MNVMTAMSFIMSLKSYCNARCTLPTFKFYAKLCQMLRQDELYKTLMKDVQNSMNDDGMAFNKVLDLYAIESKKDR